MVHPAVACVVKENENGNGDAGGRGVVYVWACVSAIPVAHDGGNSPPRSSTGLVRYASMGGIGYPTGL